MVLKMKNFFFFLFFFFTGKEWGDAECKKRETYSELVGDALFNKKKASSASKFVYK